MNNRTIHHGITTDYHGNINEHYLTRAGSGDIHIRRINDPKGTHYVLHKFDNFGEKFSLWPSSVEALNAINQVENDRAEAISFHARNTVRR